MSTNIDFIPFTNAMEDRADRTARALHAAWKTSPSVDGNILQNASRIVIASGRPCPDDTPDLLFIGDRTLAKSVRTGLRAGSPVRHFPKEYRRALKRGYFLSASERKPVAEVVTSGAFQTLQTPDPITYLRIVLPTHMADDMPALIVYSQWIDERSQRGFAQFQMDQPPRPEPPALTPRELDCLLWAAEGKTEWETAGILGIAPATVASHIGSARRKLNASNKVHLVTKALRLGVIA